MLIPKQLASRLAVVAALASLGTASAFADSRPSQETRERRPESNIIRRGSSEERQGNGSANRTRDQRQERRREDVRDRGRTNRRDDRRGVRQNDRRDNRRETWRAPAPQSGRAPSIQSHRAPGRAQAHRQPYFAHGRISGVARYGGGYRVWVAGAPYPFYVPAAHYRRDRFRVGLLINLGGIFNPRGYYDYYDGRYSRGSLRGYVESVDYRRDTFVMRNDATGSFVTVVMRDRYRDVRPGDYVEIYGDWTRSGVFQAYEVERVDYRYRSY